MKEPRPPDPHELLEQLEDLIDERYQFEVFAPGSTNFGLLVTYRQRWSRSLPGGRARQDAHARAQGDAQGHEQRSIKRERSVKELGGELSANRKDETSDTMRDEAEIVRKAQNKTNVQHDREGLVQRRIASSGDSNDDSSTGRRGVVAGDQEGVPRGGTQGGAGVQGRAQARGRDQGGRRRDEDTETSEIGNPNEELTVTYLYYELQRRYRVSEHLHRLTPVVLVAHGRAEPEPPRDRQDAARRTAWIINRVPARRSLPVRRSTTSARASSATSWRSAARREGLRRCARRWPRSQRCISDIEARRSTAREEATADAISRRAERHRPRQHRRAWARRHGSPRTGAATSRISRRRASARTRPRRPTSAACARRRTCACAWTRETAALSSRHDRLCEGVRRALPTTCSRSPALRAHFKENILYYMQAIWSFTPQDQLFFSLCDVRPGARGSAEDVRPRRLPTRAAFDVAGTPGQVVLEVERRRARWPRAWIRRRTR